MAGSTRKEAPKSQVKDKPQQQQSHEQETSTKKHQSPAKKKAEDIFLDESEEEKFKPER
jgi:hypothetical protein